jgi:hypothetical protein
MIWCTVASGRSEGKLIDRLSKQIMKISRRFLEALSSKLIDD